MPQRRKINIRALLLLLAYLLSNFPFAVFHHHDNQVVAYDNASSCEKFIYYEKTGEKCDHKSHITKKTAKCSLCDEHTVSAQVLQPCAFYFFRCGHEGRYMVRDIIAPLSNSASCLNRGPPLV